MKDLGFLKNNLTRQEIAAREEKTVEQGGCKIIRWYSVNTEGITWKCYLLSRVSVLID